MKLDLQCLDHQQTRLLNEIAQEHRGSFAELIDRISRHNRDSIDWWATVLSSRNTFQSDFHLNCCRLILTSRLLAAEPAIDTVITDHPALAAVLRQFAAQTGRRLNVECTPRSKKGKPGIGRNVVELVYNCSHRFRMWRAARKTGKPDIPMNQPLVLLDHFVFQESAGPKGFSDRYYPGILASLSQEEAQSVWYLPIFYGVKDYEKLIAGLRSAQEQFLLKEDYLTLSDYLFALSHPLRLRKLRLPDLQWHGFNLKPMVLHELRWWAFDNGTFESLLIYRLPKRLKERGIRVRLVIDWFENYIVDHTLNSGFRRYYPETVIVGYQGFITPQNFLCRFPTRAEAEANVLPHRVAVIGSGFTKIVKEFNSDLDVMTAPAFRFQGVWKARKNRPAPDQFTVLVSLPISLEEGNEILAMLSVAISENEDLQTYQYWIKQHPTHTPDRIRVAFGRDWPERFSFVSGDFNDLVEQANLLIGNTSSTCLETVAKGIPVAVTGSASRLDQNPIPPEVDRRIWCFCRDNKELSEKIRDFSGHAEENRIVYDQIAEQVRNRFFEPVTTDAVRRFLDLT